MSVTAATAVRRAEDYSAARRWLTFAAIMGPYVFYAFCWNTESFLRPYLAESLGITRQQVSAFYTLQAGGALVGAIIISQLADRYGRRLLFTLLSFGFGLGSIASVFVTDYTTALVQRFAMGFFLGGVFGCAVSLYVGMFPATLRGLLAGLVQLVYNGGDAALSWFGRLYAGSDWKQVMVIGGVGALVTGAIAFLVIPSDRKVVPWGGHATELREARHARLSELFIEGRWRLTSRLAVLCGLNFFAFQSFNGWVTTYLKDDLNYTADIVGKLMTVLHVGSMIGAIVWGMLADRFGRRFNALGFVLAAVLVAAYVATPPTATSLSILGFAYGMCLVASGVWGPYFAELYPEHMRAMAASIFNWGRIVSLFGALISGAIAERYGLTTTMYVGAATFALAALVWYSLPETLRRPAAVVPSPEASR